MLRGEKGRCSYWCVSCPWFLLSARHLLFQAGSHGGSEPRSSSTFVALPLFALRATKGRLSYEGHETTKGRLGMVGRKGNMRCSIVMAARGRLVLRWCCMVMAAGSFFWFSNLAEKACTSAGNLAMAVLRNQCPIRASRSRPDGVGERNFRAIEGL